MYFPKLNVPAQKSTTVSRFLGYDRRCGAPVGSFARMENLWSEDYPALAVRERRKSVGQAAKPHGLAAKDHLIWVDGTALYVNGTATGLTLTDSPKQLVSMGAYLIIWPDKKYINTADLTDFGSLENSVTTSDTVTFSLCDRDGTALENYLCADTAPADPHGGELWLDTSGGDVLRRYGESGWSAVEDTCIRIASAGIGSGFAVGDGVTVSGAAADEVNGNAVVRAVGTDYLVVPGLLRTASSQSTALTVRRAVPDMDYITECGNRLWGCKYGMVSGKAVNEVYGSKLGDFRNFYCFDGLSTDSYAASRGSDGPFTAACAYLGSVLFFKEECIERLYPNASGAHQIVTTQCPGVKRGSHGSVAEVDGTLYYHAMGGVYAYQGSLPVCVSAAWGTMRGTAAVAGGANGKYYLSLAENAQTQHFLVYDTARKLWHRQDNLAVTDFACCDGEMYAMSAGGSILCLRGGESESITWLAESGDLGLETPRSCYPVRMVLHLTLEANAAMTAAISYDGGTTWLAQGSVSGSGGGLRHAALHLRPRRCHSLRLRLSGTGRCTVHSLTAVYEKGSDEG